MPSFDVVSELDHHELANAVDQANREVSTRFDFKNSGSTYTLDEHAIKLKTASDFQLQQMIDILYSKLSRRGIDLKAVDPADAEISGQTHIQQVLLHEGIDSDLGRSIVKQIKQSKMKIQAAIQGDQVRISGKKRDDLQTAIAQLKQMDVDRPLQFKNFRD